MEGVKGQCFICERRVTDHSATTDGGEDTELETTVFALRKVLQAPDSLLENFLNGTPSDCGLGVCPDCRPLLAECRLVYKELCRMKRKWSEVMAKVVRKMNVTAAPEGNAVSRGENEDVRKETRRFVMNHLRAVVDEWIPLPLSGQRQTAPHESREGEAESNTASHYVVIEHVVEEEDRSDDGDGVLVEEAAPSPKKAVLSCFDGAKHKDMNPEVNKQRISSQKSKMSYDCVFCPAKRSTFFALETHLHSHTWERPFLCSVCGREFSQNGNLQQHQAIVHRSERPHQCNLCDKRFGHPGSLKDHLRYHLGEKSWKCQDCGKAFVQKSDLTRHRRVHTGERPFKCDVCGKRCSHASNLSKHKKRLHSGMVEVKRRKS